MVFSTLSTLGNIAEVAVGGKDRERYGNALYGSFGKDFVTADNRRVMIVAVTKKQWTGLIESLGLGQEINALEQRCNADFTGDEGARFVYREALFALVGREVNARKFDQLVDQFARNGVCWGSYRTVSDALSNDPRLSVANPMFQRAAHPSGETYITAGYPGILAGAERQQIRIGATPERQHRRDSRW